jgi:Tfp pilus assembly protein PilO
MLTKKIIIATVTILVLIAFAVWGTNFVQARVMDSSKPEKTELTKEIDAVNQTIAGIPAPDDQLMPKLTQLEMVLEQEGKAIPASMDSTMVINSILELAVSCAVKATPLQTSDWTVTNEYYQVYTLQIKAEGSYENIANFIDRLENDLFDNLIIVSLEISGGLITDTEPDTASLQVAVYTRN